MLYVCALAMVLQYVQSKNWKLLTQQQAYAIPGLKIIDIPNLNLGQRALQMHKEGIIDLNNAEYMYLQNGIPIRGGSGGMNIPWSSMQGRLNMGGSFTVTEGTRHLGGIPGSLLPAQLQASLFDQRQDPYAMSQSIAQTAGPATHQAAEYGGARGLDLMQQQLQAAEYGGAGGLDLMQQQLLLARSQIQDLSNQYQMNEVYQGYQSPVV